MVRVADRPQELPIPVHAATILRWSVPSARKTYRLVAVSGDDFFYSDVVHPVITEIIDIREALQSRLSERGLCFIQNILVKVRGLAVCGAADIELVQVRIGPAKHSLDRLMHLREGETARHLHPPPNQRSYSAQRNMQLIDPPE